MNWSKGLLRLWLVLSCVWVCVTGVAATIIWNNNAPARESAAHWARHEAECRTAGAPKSGACLLQARDRLYPIPNAVYLAVVVVPPLALLVFGWLALWVARGFLT
jgi:hypothetical protein